MPAYVIAETEVTDPERYEQYKAAVPAAIAAGGGRFLARGGELVVLEGDWQPSRLVVLEAWSEEVEQRYEHSLGLVGVAPRHHGQYGITPLGLVERLVLIGGAVEHAIAV